MAGSSYFHLFQSEGNQEVLCNPRVCLFFSNPEPGSPNQESQRQPEHSPERPLLLADILLLSGEDS